MSKIPAKMQLEHTKDLMFSVHAANKGGGFCIAGFYWKRPARHQDRTRVTSLSAAFIMGSGGRYSTEAEANLSIDAFRYHVEAVRGEAMMVDRGGGARGGGGHKKEYKPASRGNRDEAAAGAAVGARRAREETRDTADRAKMPKALEANLREKRMRMFTELRRRQLQFAQRAALGHARVHSWMAWRVRAMAHLQEHIQGQKCCALMDGAPDAEEHVGEHVKSLMSLKTIRSLTRIARRCLTRKATR